MIAIISPAKNMRNLKIDNINPQIIGKERYFTKETDEIIRVLKDLTPWDIQSVMKVNEKIALQSYAYFQDFNFNDKGVCGLLAYDGLVFKNIKAEDFTKEDFDYANKHIRILDAFYGMVNPLDDILPYRLEMQYPIKIQGNNLYKFWDDKIYNKLYSEDNVIVNLASEEYAKTVRRFLNEEDIFIDIDFKVNKDGKLKTLATLAKMARGQMVKYIIENKIDNPEDLKNFTFNSFKFCSNLSTPRKFVFIKED
ncbi:MAG: peroxide stress protein YaaA [Clostridiales bacterium]|uniref:peroxide stress protein YaaA n=1 Tax=Terrisporobacter sp. TaxID=1965305 RepID=UPI002A5042A0|nr:peroxide stress protein YaaA [Terrisporobacter sp.]MDD7755002.1 peroxide stress protein YaaA [Clostridiales bacterium]MDY4133817.1 peroxide stress protein YaaA [Terrisporobacter sp.]